MKRNIPAFFSGALTTALVGTIAVSALAASGRMTIEVDPVNVQVNGQVFVPTDANGKEVPVFAYNGTTYAPLRALAEAYGLEVGYDATSNMATVGKTEVKTTATPEPTPAPDTTAKLDYSDWSTEDEAAYQEFKGMWGDIEYDGRLIYVKYSGASDISDLIVGLKANYKDAIPVYALRLFNELPKTADSAILRFDFETRILFTVESDGKMSYGSAWDVER